MRVYVKIMVVLCLLAVVTAPVQAQVLPWGIAVDSSLRLEYLFGSQVIRDAFPHFDSPSYDLFRLNFAPRMPLLSGTAEVTPCPWASGRLAGSITAYQPEIEMSRFLNGSKVGAASVFAGQFEGKSNFSSWEAAGLLHLWNEGGYRFSATSGYRQRMWKYYGSLERHHEASPATDLLTSQIPFLGLQTAMYFPFWKARFEVMGSPFMTKIVSSSVVQGGNSARYGIRASQGGFLEFQMEGTVGITQSIRCGLTGRYTYEELRGPFNWSVNGADQPSLEAYLTESIGVVGLDMTLVF
jgi:hypothetical protein